MYIYFRIFPDHQDSIEINMSYFFQMSEEGFKILVMKHRMNVNAKQR